MRILLLFVICTCFFLVDGYCAITVNPASINFGDVPQGVQRTKDFEVKNPDSSPVSVTLRVSSPYKVTPPSATIQPGRSLSVRVTLTPTSRLGELTASVLIIKKGSSLNVPLSAKVVVLPLSFSPGLLDFGTVSLQERKTLEFTITNPSSKYSAEVEVRAEEPFVVSPVTATIKPKQETIISVQLQGGRRRGDLSGYLVVVTATQESFVLLKAKIITQ